MIAKPFLLTLCRSLGSDRTAARWKRWLALMLVLGCSLALRLLWLDADAPLSLTWSGAPFTDEGLYSHAARNRVLFGIWRNNEWDDRLVSPLHDALAYVVFQLFGVGYLQIRMLSVCLAVGALPLFWDLLRRDLGAWRALLGVVLWSFDFFWFQFSRLGLLEPGMVAWLVVAAWCWRRAGDSSPQWSVACGAAVAIAWIWKSLALLFVPVPILALALLPAKPGRWRVISLYILGLGGVLLMYSIMWFWPHRMEIAAYQRFYAADRLPASLTDLIPTLWQNVRSRYVWAQTPVLLGAALVGTLRLVATPRRNALPPTLALAIAWAACGCGLLIMPYSPPRYYALLVPPVVCLALSAVYFTDNSPYQTLKRAAPGLLLGASLLWSGTWYVHWARDRRTTLPTSSRALQSLVPPGELVLGVSACGLSLANHLRCAPPFAGLVNDAEPVAELGARYALVENKPDDYLRRFYPRLLAESTPITTLPFGGGRVTLYHLASGHEQ